MGQRRPRQRGEQFLRQWRLLRVLEGARRGLAVAEIKRAIEEPVDLICQMDADLSHDPRQLPSLVAATERLRLKVEQTMSFTISGGVACAEKNDTPDALFHRADGTPQRRKINSSGQDPVNAD